jgi:hypothetical protein
MLPLLLITPESFDDMFIEAAIAPVVCIRVSLKLLCVAVSVSGVAQNLFRVISDTILRDGLDLNLHCDIV